MNIFKRIKLYKIYKESIDENIEHFQNNFKLERNNWDELYTTITFIEAPRELVEKMGEYTIVEKEIKEYIIKFYGYLDLMNLNELYNVYDIKKLNETDYGITFGYSLMNNRQIILTKFFTKLLCSLLIIGGLLYGFIL